MKTPDHYERLARLARRDALGLAIFAVACAVALALAGDRCGSGKFRWVPLALASGMATAAAGALMELGEARRLARRAGIEAKFQPGEPRL